MNFLTMDYFMEVVQTKNITNAASHLHITQQTLSAHIASLEKELGCKLFDRHTPLRLTYAGEVFLRYASDFQRQDRALMQEFGDITSNQKGLLRIGISFARSYAFMPPLIKSFQEKHPHIEIQIHEGSNDELSAALIREDMDIVIGHFREKIKGIVCTPFYRERMLLILSEKLMHDIYGDSRTLVSHDLAAGNYSALSSCPFVLGIPEDIGGYAARQFFASHGLSPEIKAQSENIETLLELCRLGIGACFCPESLYRLSVNEADPDAQWIPFSLPDSMEYPILFGTSEKNRYSWQVIRDFIEIAQETDFR